ncbi:MAG: DUF2807 domain-containing protein [Flavobacteriales bacterium]|nr:DUF2807 domain-containing protein [Flavobacteriales bacterium]
MKRTTLVILALSFLGCDKDQWDDCITSTGPEREEVREPGAFQEVDLTDRIDVVLEQRASGTVAVVAGRNLMQQVRTEVRNGVLVIANDNRCNWVRSFKPRIVVRVPIADVERMTLRGNGNVTCTDTIRQDRFVLQQWGANGTAELLLSVRTADIGLHTGAGTVIARGMCEEKVDLYNGTMGPIDGSELRSPQVSVNNSGVTDIHCHPTSVLEVGIYNVGDVYYRGDPANVYPNITGTGELIKLD